MITLTAHALGTVLPVRAQPGSRKNGVLGERAGALRVAVSAPPEHGKANEALQTVLAEALGIRASRISLLSGGTSREKRFLIQDVSPEELGPLVAKWAAPGA